MASRQEKGISRRSALKGVGVSALSTGLLSSSSLAEPGRKALNMWLSLAAYSVRNALTKGEMDLFQFIDWCAELDLPGTELTSYYFPENFDRAYLRRLRNHAFRNGVTISGTAVRNNFCQPAGPAKDKDIAHVKEWIDHASELWAPHIRIFAGNVPDGASMPQGIHWVAEGIKAVLDHAAERGIMIGLENHGGITTFAEDLLAICREVGEHPWFGVNLDTGNFRRDPYQELKMTVPMAVNVQVKVEMSEGDRTVHADLERVVRILAEGGYRGWVALEYEAEADPKVEVPRYISRLKELIRA